MRAMQQRSKSLIWVTPLQRLTESLSEKSLLTDFGFCGILSSEVMSVGVSTTFEVAAALSALLLFYYPKYNKAFPNLRFGE